MSIVLMGMPGCGKSTIGKVLAQKVGAIYVSSGDIARRMAETDEETKESLEHGLMAPEYMMRDEIYRTLYDITYRGKSFILDGFPRNIDQYLWLRKRFDDIGYVVIDADKNECMDRLFHRGRPDDKVSIIDERMDYYNTHTRPMINMIGIVQKFSNPDIPYGVADLTDRMIMDIFGRLI